METNDDPAAGALHEYAIGRHEPAGRLVAELLEHAVLPARDPLVRRGVLRILVVRVEDVVVPGREGPVGGVGRRGGGNRTELVACEVLFSSRNCGRGGRRVRMMLWVKWSMFCQHYQHEQYIASGTCAHQIVLVIPLRSISPSAL